MQRFRSVVWLLITVLLVTCGPVWAAPTAVSKFGDIIVKGPWLDSRAYSTLAQADAAAVVLGRELLVTTNYVISSPTTLSSHVRIVPGGKFTKSGSGTMTFNGGFECPDNLQAFYGFSAGDVSGINITRPEWWQTNTSPGTSDMSLAINSAIKASVGPVILRPVTYAISTPILLVNNTRLIGSGPGSYNRGVGVLRLTTIRPLSTFVGTSAIRADASNISPSNPYILGIGITKLAIDMHNIRSTHVIGLELRSATNIDTLTNLRIINLDVGSYIYIGRSVNVGALESDGIIFDNLYTLSNDLVGGEYDPSIVIESANEIAFRDSKIQRSVYYNGNVGVHIRANNGGTVNAVTFAGSSITGATDGILVETLAGASQGPRWVRVQNCTFEGVKNPMRIVGSASFPAQFNTYGPGNRLQTTYPGGAQVVLGDYAYNNTIITDDYKGYGSDDTSKLVIASVLTTGNLIISNLTDVIDASSSNSTFGRTSAGGLRTTKLTADAIYAEAKITPTLQNSWTQYSGSNRSSVAYWRDPLGVVRLQGHVTGGTVGYSTPIFTLPAGYRPAKTKQFTAPSNGAYGQVYVADDGSVSLTVGSNAWVSLDGISFRAGD